MPAIQHRSRAIFRLLKIPRGADVEATIGNEVTIASVHWTPAGPRECQNHDGKTQCTHCADKTASSPREIIYATAYLPDDPNPWLLILSTIAVAWAHDTDDLTRSTLVLRRATKNNLLRAVKIGPAQRATPAAPLTAWIKTLWGSAQ